MDLPSSMGYTALLPPTAYFRIRPYQPSVSMASSSVWHLQLSLISDSAVQPGQALGGDSNYGIYNQGSSGSYTVIVSDAQIMGSTATLRNDTAYISQVAVSQLNDGAVSGSGIACGRGV